MIIDFHTHCFPDGLAARAMRALTGKCDVIPSHDGTSAGLLAAARAAGIGRSAVMPVATRPGQVDAINEWALAVRTPELSFFAAMFPGLEDAPGRLDRLAEQGFRGVKLHPDYQDFYVDDPAALRLYRMLRDRGLAALFHAGVDIGMPAPVHCPPGRLARVLDAVPGLTVIAAHMGGHLQWEDVARHLCGRDVYLDTSFASEELGPSGMMDLIRAHDPRRILFATDSPWTRPEQERARVEALPLTAEERALIFEENARRLLDPCPAPAAT